MPFVLGLHELGRGTWAYLQPDGLMGLSNAGLVVGGGASLLVDTLFDLRLTGDLLTAVREHAVTKIRAFPSPTHIGLNLNASRGARRDISLGRRRWIVIAGASKSGRT